MLCLRSVILAELRVVTDPLTILLSRVQFAFTVGFHILWPTLNIGLGLMLLVWEGLWLKTQDPVYEKLYKYWVKLFALSYGMGIVTGVPLAYQFGTNFANYSAYAGSVIGPLLGVEVMTAFFLEAVFVGMMLFGWGKVTPQLHFLATLFVAIGTFNSSFWILSANSFMHTPQGVSLIDGRLVVESWWAVIFNPSFKWRIIHMLTASYLTASLVVAGVHGWYLLTGGTSSVIKRGYNFALICVTILAPAQILFGHSSGEDVLKHQPVKIAAMEGLWETRDHAPLVLFAIPDQALEKNFYEIAIPGLSSWILGEDTRAVVQGLKDFKEDGLPPVLPIFFSFRLMVGCGVLFLILAAWYLGAVFFNCLYTQRWLAWFTILCAPLGFVATVAGWMVTELGRQPWIIFKLYKTAQGVSTIEPQFVLTSLVTFITVYLLMFLSFIYYAGSFVRKGFNDLDTHESYLQVISHTAHIKE
jgi:cytochrome d ubiquinol oxidase subunit I